jgi:DNA-binding response OmpR family regulator
MEEIKSKILLVEDDSNFGNVLKNYLELNDFDVTLERDGRLGLAAFQREKFDICLLDVMMPHVDGFTLAEEIRDIDPDVPLFFLSAKTMKEDIINGYRLGADDYITKPFDSEVLLLKIKAILKRNEETKHETENKEFDLGIYHFNPKLRELIVHGKTQTLSPKENELLRMLCEYKNDLLPRETALKRIWGSDTYFNGRSMDVYIAKLRKYLKDDTKVEIVNIHGNGFRLVVAES